MRILYWNTGFDLNIEQPLRFISNQHVCQGWGEYYSGTRLAQNDKHEYTKNIVLEYYSSTDFPLLVLVCSVLAPALTCVLSFFSHGVCWKNFRVLISVLAHGVLRSLCWNRPRYQILISNKPQDLFWSSPCVLSSLSQCLLTKFPGANRFVGPWSSESAGSPTATSEGT